MSFTARKLSPRISALRDSFFNYVTLLLHGNGTSGGNNNIFQDSSANAFSITRTGRPTQGSLSPYNQNWSNYFNGTAGNYLTCPKEAFITNSQINNNWTIEGWFNFSNLSVINGCYCISDYLYLNINSTTIQFMYGIGLNRVVITASKSLSINKWYHIAASCNSGTIKLYVDGISVGSVSTIAQSNTGQVTPYLYIGASDQYPFSGTLDFFLNGYISNFRITSSGLYPNNFTTPTSPLTAISGTSLLTCQSNQFKDNSSNNYSIIENGIAFVEQFSPFQQPSPYSIVNNVGSGQFGFVSGQTQIWVSTVNSRFYFTSGTFTIEFWIYLSANRTTAQNTIISNISSTLSGWSIGLNSSNSIIVKLNGSTAINITGSPIPVGSWNHVAVSGVTGSYKLFVNGIQHGSTYTGATSLAGTSNVRVGADANATTTNLLESAYLSNLRITQTNVYTTNFTPPTSPITINSNGGALPSNAPDGSPSNVPLLLDFTNGQIFDNASKNDLETSGNTSVNTSIKKFGTGSMYFTSSSDRLILPATSVGSQLYYGTGSFTIECWYYLGTLSTTGFGIIISQSVSTNNNLLLYIDTNSAIGLWLGNIDLGKSANGVVQPNIWNYIALVRDGTNVQIYVNGTSVFNVSNSSSIGQNMVACINGYGHSNLYGNTCYIDDLRITKGIARTIVTPTAQFPDF